MTAEALGQFLELAKLRALWEAEDGDNGHFYSPWNPYGDGSFSLLNVSTTATLDKNGKFEVCDAANGTSYVVSPQSLVPSAKMADLDVSGGACSSIYGLNIAIAKKSATHDRLKFTGFMKPKPLENMWAYN